METKPWGDTPRLPKPKNNIRVLLHNIQGLKRGKHGRSQVAELDTEIARLNIDILAMTEINNHFKILPAQDQWSERMQALPRNHSVCATNIHSASNRNHLYGGSAQMLFGPMSYRATTSERDPAGLGRWVSTRCQGKGGICIRFITGYRPNLDRDGGPYTVYSQQEKRFKQVDPDGDRCPRQAFFEDLHQEMLGWLTEGEQIVLSLDANEDVRHGGIAQWVETWGLVDAHRQAHPNLPSVETCSSNTSAVPIDGIWISAGLNLLSAGYLDYGAFATGRSNHRAIWIDLEWDAALGYESPPNVYKPPDRLNLKDPRVIRRYNIFVKKEFYRHNLFQKLYHLEGIAIHRSLSHEEHQTYTLICQQAMEIRQGAKRKCRKLHMRKYPFSDTLHMGRETVRLWDLVIKRKEEDRKIGRQPIRRLSKLLKIPYPLQVPLPMAIRKRSQARQAYAIIQKKADQHRETFYKRLVQAQVKESKGKRTAESIEKQTRSAFRQKSIYRQIRRVQGKPRTGGVSYLTVQDKDDTAQGCWTQDEMVQACAKEGITRFSQSEQTPFLTEPLLSDFGYLGDSPATQQVLEGIYHIPPNTDPYARKLIACLRRSPLLPCISKSISTQDHIQAWNKARPNTASHPGGPLYSDIIAGTKDNEIAAFDAATANLPLYDGFVNSNWTSATECIIHKKANVPAVEKMRIICLFDASFNMINKIIGRRLVQSGEANDMLPWECYGSRKRRRASECALNKVLTTDILRTTHQPASICCNDARQCYDRIVHSVANICMQRMGAPPEVPKLLLGTIAELQRYIRTAFGDSTNAYGAVRFPPLQGICQGNGAGPAIWLIVSAPVIEMLKKEGYGLHLESAISKEYFHFLCYTFVDDTDLVDSRGMWASDEEITESMQEALDHWEGGIRATGGALVPSKSYWYLIRQEWMKKNRKWGWYYRSEEEAPGELTLRDHTGTHQTLERLNPEVAKETLGVWTTIDGNMHQNKMQLRAKAQKWADQVRTGRLSKAAAFISLQQTIMKALEYPLMTTSFSKQDCFFIMKPILTVALPKLGYPYPSFPIRIRHGPLMMQGVGLPSLWHRQLAHKLWACLAHGTSPDLLGCNLRASLEALQLTVGTQTHLLDADFQTLGKLAPPSWLTELWYSCQDSHMKMQFPALPWKLARLEDRFLMDEFVKFGFKGGELKQLNEVRLSLSVLRLSDITTGEGNELLQAAYQGESFTDNYAVLEFHWSKPPVPPKAWLTTWKAALRTCFLSPNRPDLKLRLPLGTWCTTTPDNYPWVWSPSQDRVFRVTPSALEYEITAFSKLPGRTRRRKYRKLQLDIDELPSDVLRTTIFYPSHNPDIISMQGARPNIVPVPIQPPDDDAWSLEFINMNDGGAAVAQGITQGSAVAVCDGSFKEGHGTASLTMLPHLASEHPNQINASHITPGHAQEMDAYRTEVGGIYGIVTIIEHLVEAFDIETGSITLGCDCESALKAVFEYEYITPSQSCFDLLQIIRGKIDKCPIKILPKHIYGHQDDFVSFEYLPTWAKLNVTMDSCAKATWNASRHRDPTYLTSSSNCSLWYKHRRLSRWDPNQIQDLIFGEQIESHWEQKGTFSRAVIASIDWHNAGRAIKRLPLYQRLWIPKWGCNFLTVGTVRQTRNATVDPTCPQCDAREDAEHLLRCAAPRATNCWNKMTAALVTWMGKNSTDPAIRQAWQQGLNAFRMGRLPPLPTHPIIRLALQEQAQIGWIQAFRGRISIHWRLAQASYLSSHHPLLSADFWTSGLIQRLFSFPWEFWELRKAVIKDPTSRFGLRWRTMIDARVIAEFNQGSDELRQKDKRWFRRPMNDLLDENTEFKQEWLDHVTLARLRADGAPPTTRTRDIRYHFQPI